MMIPKWFAQVEARSNKNDITSASLILKFVHFHTVIIIFSFDAPSGILIGWPSKFNKIFLL